MSVERVLGLVLMVALVLFVLWFLLKLAGQA